MGQGQDQAQAQGREPGAAPTRDRSAAETGGAVGSVVLVGAGPGDPGLLTVRGREELAAADVVVIDRLVAPELVALAPASARVLYVGKAPDAHSADQAEIEEMLVREARAGHRVVRLKGGDPYLFGRGGEEAVACAESGVPCTVIPGVSSALAVPAAAGVPVTHRGLSQAVTVVSGHLAPGHPDSAVDWEALAASGASLVVLMGVRHLGKIVVFLQEHGRPGTTPITVIERGTTAAQRVVRSTLAEIDDAGLRTGLRSPAVIVIGEVAGLELAGTPPSGAILAAPIKAAAVNELHARLAGVRVLLPRSRPGPSALAGLLRTCGADVLQVHVLSPAVDAAELPVSGWLAVPDVAAGQALADGLRAAGRDARSLHGIRLAGCAAALAPLGLLPDASQAPDQALTVGREVTVRLRRMPLPRPVADVLAAGQIDAVALASSGTARALGEELAAFGSASPTAIAGAATGLPAPGLAATGLAATGLAATGLATTGLAATGLAATGLAAALANCAVAAIGPQTAAAAQHSGLNVSAVAAEPDLYSLVVALADVIETRGRTGYPEG